MSDEQQVATAADGVDAEVVEVAVVEDEFLEGELLEDELLGEDDEESDVDVLGDVMVLEEVDTALVLPVWEPTGEPRVDEALDDLVRLDPDDVHQHAAIYADVHERLRDVLSNLGSTA